MVAYVYARGSVFEDEVNRYMTTGVPIIPSDPTRGIIGGSKLGNVSSRDVAENKASMARSNAKKPSPFE